MTTFLLFISLFLNVLALFSIIILFLRQNRFLQVEKKQEKMLQEMEEVISAYLVQMKEENEDFIKRMGKIERNAQTFPNGESRVTIKKSKDDSHLEKNVSLQNRIGKANAYSAANAYKQNAVVPSSHASNNSKVIANDKVDLPPLETNTILADVNEKENSQDQSLLNDILQLKKQGYNETEIAQKLNKGKTEINLLLKFNQKK
ncbi:hypothetical protein RRV45_09505 [Bacillus sp. DTU_2020_1000418_1_SI_GHA_SEK_038]|uniref:hypothetical protein n=1 Tax=Bacillus sp. DTU_2020_1000418_1_SI_GHA_SEK_038 TaxID=3077585 RepID=UPI0028F0397F|nr:hypothetical protein [Bacillus sp. DTU_2020_1000418_1_SI_GHA_SEK_038]WNS77202.1 hypothetical protein RRV45_09505 [Bacillus sp. DTU_2020_1000418_1_SI_GHA_SEK_038]